MKVSFEISRNVNKQAATAGVKTGAAIKSPRVAPQHAEVLRAVRAVNSLSKRAYDASMTNNLNGDFMASPSSANAEILVSLYVARNRSRKLCRDNQYAKGIIRTYKNNVVGDDPFRLEMKVGTRDAKGKFTEETETNRLIEDAWKEAGLPENCTVRQDMSRLELYHLVVASAKRDGSILARHWRDYPHNKYGYALQLLESDRLQESYMGRAENGNQIRFSIERDSWDRAVGYWILTRHPGDTFGYNSPISNSGRAGAPAYLFRERVDAVNIIHFNNLRDRAEQDIGMTELDTIIQTLHRIEQFDISHVTAAIWASCKPFFMVQEFPTGMEYVGEGLKAAMDSAGDDTGEVVAAVEPATGEKLPPGMKPMLVDPKFPIESGPEFKREQLRGVASGAGIAYHTLANDLASVNFSSGRLGENAQRDQFKVDQAHTVLSFVRLHFNAWLKNAIQAGQLPGITMSRYEEIAKAACFHSKRWPYVNPLQDAQADIIRIEAGLDSRSRVIAESERGGDVETVDAEIASDRAVDESHSLDFSGGGGTTEEDGTDMTDKTDGTNGAGGSDGATPPKKPKVSRVNNGRLDRTVRVLAVTGDQRNGHH